MGRQKDGEAKRWGGKNMGRQKNGQEKNWEAKKWEGKKMGREGGDVASLPRSDRPKSRRDRANRPVRR